MPGTAKPTRVKNRMQLTDLWEVDGVLNVDGTQNVAGTLNVSGVQKIPGEFDLRGRPDGGTIALVAPSGNDRDINIQLKDANGVNCVGHHNVELTLYLDVVGLAYAVTGGTTGIVDNGAGIIVPLVAKKVFKARTDAVGAIALTWTDTASEVAFLGIEFQSGRTIFSAALTI